MTPEAQRIAIAEACGWTRVRLCTEAGDWNGQIRGRRPQDTFFGDELYEVPDFLSDLNAMHEAEKVLCKNENSGYEYDRNLFEVTEAGKEEGGFVVNYMRLWHATAAQRAEAFLHTIGKWDDSK